MGLFGRKNKVRKHVEAEEQQEVVMQKTSDKIVFKQVTNNDLENAEYVLKIKEGIPLCLNFDNLEVKEANKILAFLVGATFALGGTSFELNEKSFLFCIKETLADGSIYEFVKGVKEQ